jgi:hypothetical protein
MDGFVSWLHSLRLLRECNPSYGVLTLSPMGLSPTEHASLRWSHYGPKTRSYGEQTPRAQFRLDFLIASNNVKSRCYTVKNEDRRTDLTLRRSSKICCVFNRNGFSDHTGWNRRPVVVSPSAPGRAPVAYEGRGFPQPGCCGNGPRGRPVGPCRTPPKTTSESSVQQRGKPMSTT